MSGVHAAQAAAPTEAQQQTSRRGQRQPSPMRIAHDGLRSPGQRIDPAAAWRLSSAFAHDFSGVRVHTDERAARAASALGADAYTRGNHIGFAPRRYAPGTADGLRLLAHEAAHVVQQARSAPAVDGIAPHDAASERSADAASRFVSERATRSPLDALRSFRPAGRPWAVQLQRVTSTGTQVFEEQRLGLAPGEYGPPTGTVEVRKGVDVEVSKGRVESNLLSIEYTGMAAGKTEWLQFLWLEMTATTPKGPARVSGSVPTTSGAIPFSTAAAPTWAVDSGPGNPFYAAGGALAIRQSNALAIFDRPGGASAGPLANAVFGAGLGATSVTFTGHFDTYLIRDGKTIYHVPWSASTVFTQSKGSLVTAPVTYALGKPGNVTALDPALRGVLHAAYPAYKHIQ
jgi:Domain of unknown function (DUF4157)